VGLIAEPMVAEATVGAAIIGTMTTSWPSRIVPGIVFGFSR
jgi:hypothetical protein